MTWVRGSTESLSRVDQNHPGRVAQAVNSIVTQSITMAKHFQFKQALDICRDQGHYTSRDPFNRPGTGFSELIGQIYVGVIL